MSDCIYQDNPGSGFVGSHNGRCARGTATQDVHLGATHHARIAGWCGHVCDQCSRELAKRGKDVAIRPLETEQPAEPKGETPKGKLAAGLTAGFHYGTSFAPCNGVLQWSDELHTDGRQIAVCDACASKCAPVS